MKVVIENKVILCYNHLDKLQYIGQVIEIIFAKSRKSCLYNLKYIYFFTRNQQKP